MRQWRQDIKAGNKVKKLLAYLVSIMIAIGAPMAEASERVPARAKTHTSKVTHKAKAKAKAKKKVKASAKKATKKVSAKQAKRIKGKSRKHRIVSEYQERPVAKSAALAQAPAQVYYGNPASDALQLRSAAVLVLDQETGEALYSKNPDVATPIASITKLMTSMVVLDAGLAMAEEITIGMEDVDRLKYTSSRLALGTTLSREELLHLALIASENRAAAALSRAYPGGREAFVRAMNRKAAELGMSNTWFVDGTGLDSSNRSTAADLARLVSAAYRYPVISQISSTGQYGVSVPGRQVVKIRDHGKIRRVSREVMRHVAFANTNALTRNPNWDIGLSKTGYINEAGHCLVMQANIADRQVIMVLLDSWGKLSRIGDAARVRKWLENHYSGRVAQLDKDRSV
jgi:D-alanyl-D-alanine endopeptidase (penicillin-binding protein 7)